MRRSRLLFLVIILCLLGGGVYVFLNSQQLGLTLPSLPEVEHLADVAAGELGDKSIPKWRDFLARTGKFAEEHPTMLEIWLLRGAGALVVRDWDAGYEAGEHIVMLKEQVDPTTEKLLKALWAKKWLPASDLSRNSTLELLNELFKSKAADGGIYNCSLSSVTPNDGWLFFKTDKGDSFAVEKMREVKQSISTSPPFFCQITGGIYRYEPKRDVALEVLNIPLRDPGATLLAVELLSHLKDLSTKTL